MGLLKSVFKWLAIIVLALAAVLVIGGYFISPTFSVTRSTVIAAPPEKVYALVADPRHWKERSVWNQRDPAMKIGRPRQLYTGPTQRDYVEIEKRA